MNLVEMLTHTNRQIHACKGVCTECHQDAVKQVNTVERWLKTSESEDAIARVLAGLRPEEEWPEVELLARAKIRNSPAGYRQMWVTEAKQVIKKIIKRAKE